MYRPRECEHCHASYRPKSPEQRTCSHTCGQRLRRLRTPAPNTYKGRTCEVCGERYDASYGDQRTCGRACGERMRRTITGTLPAEATPVIVPSPPEQRTCDDCGQTFETRHRSRLCSPCRTEAGRAEQARRQARRQGRRCAWCTTALDAAMPLGRKYCSPRCLAWWHTHNRTVQAGALDVTLIDWTACIECGQHFPHRVSSRPRYCGDRCNRKARARQRAHEIRAGNRLSDAFTTREIAERDGWRCHLCKRRVPDVPYTGKRTDPTVDHLVPVVDGGLHVRSNVALAHMWCNSKRGATGTAQLMLLG